MFFYIFVSTCDIFRNLCHSGGLPTTENSNLLEPLLQQHERRMMAANMFGVFSQIYEV